MNDLAREIQELRGLSMNDLVNRYVELFGKTPRVKHREWLWKRCAWKIQEERYGGLSQAARRRLEEIIAEIDLPLVENQRRVSGLLRGKRRAPEDKVGTVFTRTWHGREIRVQVVETGYEWDGVVYTSLSAVAKAVTGAHWNGRLFFGLTKRKKR